MRRNSSIAEGDFTELDLTAAIEDDLLRVSWNKSSGAIASAKQGILSIADGTSVTELELNAERLRAGGLVYPYESANATVRLRVITTGREVTESARVFGVDRDANPPWMAPALSETAEKPPAALLIRRRFQRRGFPS